MKRFWDKVNKTDTCWYWLAYTNIKGYGQFKFNGTMRTTHRVSYELVHGTIPAGLLVCHKCDNPSCVNPAHLFLGTNDDNMKDMVNKNRSHKPTGSINPKAKLVESDVIEIRNMYKTGRYTQLEIAKLYCISQPTVKDITKRQTWRHI